MIEKKYFNEFAYLILALLIVFFLSTHSPNIEYDAFTYIKSDSIRPLIYPLFIWLFHWAGSYQFSLLMWVQGILLFSALLYARNWLKINLKLSDFSIFLVCLLVILTISFRFQIWFIQSEGLAFPFFIWTFFLLIECFNGVNLKKLFYLSLWVSILVLTRLQFYYFYGMFGILCIWYVWQRTSIKLVCMGTSILFGSMLLTILIDHSYHYYKHGFFAGAPYGGLMILVQTIYLADSDAFKYFQDPIKKAYVKTMLDQRDAKQLNRDVNLLTTMKPSYYEYAYQSYSRNYLSIQSIIGGTLKTSIENTLGKVTNYQSDSLSIDINKTILSHEAKKNLFFFLWKFVKCMGGIPLFLFFVILLCALLYRIVKDKMREVDLSTIFVMVVTIITFLNAAIIAGCNPDIPVYFCYSQFMFYCLAAFFVTKTSDVIVDQN